MGKSVSRPNEANTWRIYLIPTLIGAGQNSVPAAGNASHLRCADTQTKALPIYA